MLICSMQAPGCRSSGGCPDPVDYKHIPARIVGWSEGHRHTCHSPKVLLIEAMQVETQAAAALSNPRAALWDFTHKVQRYPTSF